MASPEAAAQASARLRGDFWKFWAGQTCSSLGSAFTLFALPLLVYTHTGSAIDLALASAMATLPGLLFGLVIGAWVDRADRKRLMIGADLLRAVAIATLAALVGGGQLALWWIYAVGFVSAALATCFGAAQTTAIVSLVDENELVAANGRIQASYSAATILGPLLAGMVAAALPIASLLLIDALTFVVSAVSLAAIRTSFNRLGALPPPSIGAAIREGLAYLFGHPLLRYLALFGLLLNFVVATIGAQLVLFAKGHLHADDVQLGLMYSAQSVGVFVCALAAGRIRRHARFSRVILGSVVAHGLLTIGLAISPFPWLAAACLCGMAGLIALMGINVLSLRQAIVPNQLLGRVSSSLGVIIGMAMPLGSLAGGFAIERTQNVQLVFAAIGGLIFAIGVAFLGSPLRDAERYLAEDQRQ